MEDKFYAWLKEEAEKAEVTHEEAFHDEADYTEGCRDSFNEILLQYESLNKKED